MGLQIEDGRGSGQQAGVNSEGLLRTAAVSATVEHHVNHHHGEAYTHSFDVTAAGADDCILFMKNESDTDMTIEGFYLAVAGACEVYAEINNEGTRNAASAFIPVNVNAGSGNSAEGTFETGTDLAGGAATLTSGDEVGRGAFFAASNTQWYNFNQDLILPKNKTLTLWVNAAVQVIGMVEFNYHKDELG
jgi:hypothetical protein